MPWHLEDTHPDCEGIAVVKDDDGELVGCHRTEAQAKKQLAALNIAEPEERAGSGPATILVDVDGTLSLPNGPNSSLIERLNGRDALKLIVTGRLNSQRDATILFLDRIGLDYSGVFTNPGGSSDAHKMETARDLMRNHDIILAVDDNPKTRALYEELGIPTESPTTRAQEAQEILAQLRAKH